MIVRKKLDPVIIIRRTWKRTLTLAVISTGVCFLFYHVDPSLFFVDTLPASILGVAIAFLIGFRVNSAYERWWEARKIWGAIVNDSRSFSRQVLSMFYASEDRHREMRLLQIRMIYRQMAFAYALKNSLRKQDVLAELEPFLEAKELEGLKNEKNIPNALLLNQGYDLQTARAEGFIDDFRQMQIDFKLSSLCDSMGAAERIKNTVFPRQYSVYSSLFVRIYTYLLPLVLVKASGWLTIPSTLIIGFIFYALDTIANGIENPFENSINDIPMSAISRTIEINLRQMLGEKEVPPAVEPVKGFLY